MGRVSFYFSPYRSAYKNLAIDEWLLDNTGKEDIVLYLYINDNAVIIGKNQNPWKECRINKMNEDGVELARRVTGGGAVYHDSGNLNFSFIAGEAVYDEQRQFSLILKAVSSLGIPCEFSGKNDLTANGMKFSGNAFCKRQALMHHGTLLIEADMQKLADYLNPDIKKLRSKGIDSVRKRVCNLSELRRGLTPESMAQALHTAFDCEYGRAEILTLTEADEQAILPYYNKQRDEEWRLKKTPEFDITIDERFSFGGVTLHMNVKKGRVESVLVFTDANDIALKESVEKRLLGAQFTADKLYSALYGKDERLNELAALLKTQI